MRRVAVFLMFALALAGLAPAALADPATRDLASPGPSSFGSR